MLTRLTLLYTGLAAFALGISLFMLADLGTPPWDVFHTGVARLLDVAVGPVIIGTGVLLLLIWIPLRERPGLGTASNALLVGTFVTVYGRFMPDAPPDSLALRVALVAVAICTMGMGTGMYIGARFGPGPRDGLMTSISRRTGRSIRTVRTCIEVTVLMAGIALGGSFGFATIAFALGIGLIAQRTIPFFTALTAPPDLAIE